MLLPISINIATWNRRNDLARCLASIAIQEGPKPEIIVLDDGSTDGTPDWVRTHYPRVRLKTDDRRMGQIYRRNQGATLTESTYLLFVDSDSELPDSRFLINLQERYESRAGIGELGGEIAVFAGEKDVAFGKGLTRSGYSCRIPAPRERDELTACAYLSGCNIFLRREIFQKVGGFDPYYLWGHEDTDLGIAITQKLGLKNYAHFSTGVLHHAAVSGRNSNESRLYCQARVRFLIKRWGLGRSIFQAAWDLGQLARNFMAGGTRREQVREYAGTILRAYCDGWANFGEIRRARNLNFLTPEAMSDFYNLRAGSKQK